MFSAEQIQAIAAVATFLAALAAVWATFKAPRLAAEFAERLRRESAQADEKHRLQVYILTTLLQYREQIANPASVAALNMIDIVFVESDEVRAAWRNFLVSTDAKPFSSERSIERYLFLIEKIVRHLGLHDRISVGDVQSTYFPKGLADLYEANALEAQHKVKALRADPTTA